MAGVDRPTVLLIWPAGSKSKDVIPLFLAFLVPQLLKVADVTVLDCWVWNLRHDSQLFADIVKRINPNLIGISAWSADWETATGMTDTLHALMPDVPIVLGGPHVSVTETVGTADFSLVGEGERTFPQLVNLLVGQASKEDLTQLPGLRFEGQKLRVSSAPIDDLDTLGLPRYQSLSLDWYHERGYCYRGGDMRQAPVLATRGCPYGCKFCSASLISGRKIRKHSIAYLRELLIYLKRDFDIAYVNIVDDNFTFSPDYVKQFCEMVLQNRDVLGDMAFSTPNGIRVERSDAEMFRMMKKAGWNYVIFAPESGSQHVVNLMGKHLDLGVVPNRVEMAHAAGLSVEAFFIINYPGEAEEDIEQTKRFIERVPFDDISIHVFTPLPYTESWKELVERGELDRDYIIKRYNEVDWIANGREFEDLERYASALLDIVNTRKAHAV